MRLKGLDFSKTWRGKKGAGEAEGHLEKPTRVAVGGHESRRRDQGGSAPTKGDYRAWSTQPLVLFVLFQHQVFLLMQFSVWLRPDT